MRRVSLVACLLLVSTVAIAQQNPEVVQDDAIVLEVAAGSAIAGNQTGCAQIAEVGGFGEMGKVNFLATERTADRCFCSAFADCAEFTDKSCSDSTNPCSCTSQDRNCSLMKRGYVRCNGVTTYCGPKCSFPNCDPTCPGRSCTFDSDCSNNPCPQGSCREGQCSCDA